MRLNAGVCSYSYLWGRIAKAAGFSAVTMMVALVGGGCQERLREKEAISSSSSSDTIGQTAVSNAPPGMEASPLDSTNIMRAFAARGVIREFPDGGKSVLIKHEDIPGFMPRMTMEFEVRDTNELRELRVGDTVTFNLRATQEESWIDGLRRVVPGEPSAGAKPADPSSAVLLHAAELKPGDPMPDVELLAEDGSMVRLSDFKGKAVAFSFIFTRCPLPDYCSRVNQNFGRARELLLQSADAPLNWQFISISFDPEFDKPGVLGRYAFSYRGALTNQWLFASASAPVLKEMSSKLDFRFANEAGSFQHNLRTVVVDARQRVWRQLNGNKWTADELVEAMMEAANKRD